LAKDAREKRSDLFAKNVRNFVGNKGLSSGIVDTILNMPDKFHLFHNGITFSVSDIKPGAGNIFTFISPQAINGCQTINTIYEYFKDQPDDENLKKAQVFCRIFRLEKDCIEKVCEASNTQIKISHADLRSNDDVQIKLEKFINSIPKKEYLYERKKERRKGKIKKRKISMGELAQWTYSCKIGDPAEAKNKKAELFEIFSGRALYIKIFPDNFDPEEMEFICDIGIFVREKRLKAKRGRDKKLISYADLHIIAGMFSLGKANNKSFSRIFKIIDSVIDKKPLSKYGGDYNKIFTKDKDTWTLIKKKLKK
jgi:hypothetical protein